MGQACRTLHPFYETPRCTRRDLSHVVQAKHRDLREAHTASLSSKLQDVQFVKYLRDAVRHGAVTCSIRIWTHPHVTAGKRYRMENGEIEIDEVESITLNEITPDLARPLASKRT